MVTNKRIAAQTVKIKIEATLPLPPMLQVKTTAQSNCSDCGKRRGKPKLIQQGGNPLLQHVANILVNMVGGEYTPEQIVGGFKMLDRVLREHYGGK